MAQPGRRITPTPLGIHSPGFHTSHVTPDQFAPDSSWDTNAAFTNQPNELLHSRKRDNCFNKRGGEGRGMAVIRLRWRRTAVTKRLELEEGSSTRKEEGRVKVEPCTHDTLYSRIHCYQFQLGTGQNIMAAKLTLISRVLLYSYT